MRSRSARVLVLGVTALCLVAVALWDRIGEAIGERDLTHAIVLRENGVLREAGVRDDGKAKAFSAANDALERRLKERGLALGSAVFLRIFKAQSELEVWMRRGARYELFATYPVCRWSGFLGPKEAAGDRQAPEGVYTVAAEQLNPASRHHRAFNLGFPNALDRSYKRTGTFLMVHGGCSSVGCFAMTDAAIDEIWRLVTMALAAGQPRFQVHIYPFRMSETSLRRWAGHPWHSFWQDLRYGHDLFEADRVPPRVSVCNGHYAFQHSAGETDDGGAVEPGCPSVAGVPASGGSHDGSVPGNAVTLQR